MLSKILQRMGWNVTERQEKDDLESLNSKEENMEQVRASLHGVGGPQLGEGTCGGSPQLSRKRDQIKMRDYVDRRVTPPKRVTSPTWGPPPPCKQALNDVTRAFWPNVGKFWF